MIRLLLPTILSLLLSACLTLPKINGAEAPGPTKDSAQSLFIKGIDRFEPSQRTEAFLELEQNFSDSAWNRRAKILANLAGSRRLLEKQLRRQQAVISKQQNDKLTLKKLTQENNLLQEQVKVLKSLIIDLELHQP